MGNQRITQPQLIDKLTLRNILSTNNITLCGSNYYASLFNIAGATYTVNLIPAPTGIPVASTSQIIVSNFYNPYFNNTYNKIISSLEIPFTDGDSTGIGAIEILNGSAYVYNINAIILSPNATMRVTTIGSYYSDFTYPSWAFGFLYIQGDGYDISFYLDYPNPNLNPSTNQSLIPSNGWTPFPMTITAA